VKTIGHTSDGQEVVLRSEARADIARVDAELATNAWAFRQASEQLRTFSVDELCECNACATCVKQAFAVGQATTFEACAAAIEAIVLRRRQA
jgi:hypothetical protein